MSSAFKTDFLKLHSWAAADPVLRADFNHNFSLIDSALAALSSRAGSCSIFSGSYSGTGDAAFSLSFNKLPSLIFIQRSDNVSGSLAVVRQDGRLSGSETAAKISISGNTLTLTAVSPTKPGINVSGKTYSYVAVASVV